MGCYFQLLFRFPFLFSLSSLFSLLFSLLSSPFSSLSFSFSPPSFHRRGRSIACVEYRSLNGSLCFSWWICLDCFPSCSYLFVQIFSCSSSCEPTGYYHHHYYHHCSYYLPNIISNKLPSPTTTKKNRKFSLREEKPKKQLTLSSPKNCKIEWIDCLWPQEKQRKERGCMVT